MAVSWTFKNYKTSFRVDIELYKDYIQKWNLGNEEFCGNTRLKGKVFRIISSFPNFHECLISIFII
jgi:hypothetical protein